MSNFYKIDSGLLEYLKSLNLNPEMILSESNILYNALSSQKISVSQKQYINLMQTLDRHIGDDQVLNIGHLDRIMMFSPPLFAALCATNGLTCFKRIAQYKKLIGPFILKVHETSSHVSLEFVFDDGHTPIPRYTILTEQILMVSILRKGTGLTIRPTEVTCIYDIRSDAIDNYYGIRVNKGNQNIITFNKEDLMKPFLTHNNAMWSYLEPEMKKRIQMLEETPSYTDQVEKILMQLIPAGEDTIHLVAEKLAVSTRSLQRYLLNEHTTFVDLKNKTRELMAKNYLKNEMISSDEVAFLVGYADFNSFNRAFKNWTGSTVANYRKQLIS